MKQGTKLSSIKLKDMTNFNQIKETIERLTGRTVISLHCESKGYVFKTKCKGWQIIEFAFINNCANLGTDNCSLL